MRKKLKDIVVLLTKNEKKYPRKNRDNGDLKEEAVFLITALSLTGFFAHYVGITVLSIWLNQIPFKRVYHFIWFLIYHSVSDIVYLGWSSISSPEPTTGTVLKEK